MAPFHGIIKWCTMYDHRLIMYHYRMCVTDAWLM